jgi:hypothetical protein
MIKDGQAILATVTYQTGELNFFSPNQQGFVGKVNAVYYREPELKNEVLKRKEDNINFPYGQGSFSNDYQEDSFGASWTGVIRTAYSDSYKFYTRTDDGVRLWVNGKLLIDKWQDMGTTEFSAELPLQAGKEYPIKMEYYDRGGEAYAELSWESNLSHRSVIKEIGSFDIGYTFQNPYGLEADWNATYFKGREFKEQILTKKEPTLFFSSNKDPFTSGVPNENFCARYTSQIKIPQSGTYTFFTTSDDGIRVKLNGKLLIDQWTWMGATEFSENANFQKGEETNVEVEYFQGGGGKFLKVEWQTPNGARELLVQKGKQIRYSPNINLDIYPGRIYSKDLNGDNRNDIIILHPTYNGKVSILLQEHDFFLSSPLVLKAGKDPKEILFADLDSDGREEMIVVSKNSLNFLVFWNKKNDWKQEISPKWSESIKDIRIQNTLSRKNKDNVSLLIVGKTGAMAKIAYIPGRGWSQFEAISPNAKDEILSTNEATTESKCIPLEMKKKVCYDKEKRDFIIRDTSFR